MNYLFIFFIVIIPFIVYPEPLLGPIKNEYIIKNHFIYLLFIIIVIKNFALVFKNKFLNLKNTDKLVFLYLFFCCLSWFFNRIYFFPEQLMLTIIYCLIFLSLSHAKPESFKDYPITFYWKIALFLTCAYGAYQAVSHMEVSSTLGNRNFFACFIAAGLPFLTQSLIQNFRRKSKYIIFDIFLTAISIFNLYCTKSRAAYIIVLFQIAFLLFILIKRKILLFSFILLIVIGIFIIPKSNAFLKRQIQGDVRPFIWQATCQMIAEHPFMGIGTGNFYLRYPAYRIHEYFLLSKSTDTTKHAHNELLEIWAEAGSLAFFSLIGIFIVLVINIINNFKKSKLSPFSYAVSVSCLSIALHNCVDVNMRYTSMSVIFWMNLGILASFFDTKTVKVGLSRSILKLKIPGLILLVCFFIYLAWIFVIRSYGTEMNFQKGIDSKDKKDYQKAAYYYEKALNYDNSNLSLLYHYAYILDLKRLTDKTIKIYKKIIKIGPYYAATRKNLATCYLKQGDFQNAIKEYNIQLLLNPYDPDIYLNSAYCYRQLGLNDKALLSHQKALETYQLIAERLLEDGYYQKAVSYLSTAIQVDSSNKDIVRLLVKAYVKSGEKRNAVELVNIFLHHYPQDKKYIEHLNSLIK